MKHMKLKLKKDVVIPAGTVFSAKGVPENTHRDTSAFVMHTCGFGRNSTGELYVGHEVNDPEFQEWFETVES